MSEISEKPQILENYPLHLPDKPFPTGKVSYVQFLDWMDEDTHAEWVDGEIELMPSPVSVKHQRILSFLQGVLKGFAEANDLGEVFTMGLQMKLPGKQGSGREPDVLFVSNANLKRLRPTFLDGPADLAIEIISPESVDRDRVIKFGEYAEGGVLEYWLIDPEEQQAEFYQLGQDKQYQKIEPDSDGKYYSKVLAGFWLRVNWFWREPLPSVTEVLKLVGGPAYQAYLNRQPSQEL